MSKNTTKDEHQPHFYEEPASDKRRQQCDRRQQDGKGYTYVQMVGWICRREKSRRDHDNDTDY